MRRIKRVAIDDAAQTYLDRRQAKVNGTRHSNLNIENEWKSARQTQAMGRVFSTLQGMMGNRQRCMYCLDSHGCDIEHFRPKSHYSRWMFKWSNLLLCCTECGRIKGSQSPMVGSRMLLVDPSREEPWDYLDFDPITGNMTARFDAQINDFSDRGQYTVAVLQLDRREALAQGYVRTYSRLCVVINGFLQTHAGNLIDELIRDDDHGLLGWCFKGSGQNEPLFSQLKREHPALWQDCLTAFRYL